MKYGKKKKKKKKKLDENKKVYNLKNYSQGKVANMKGSILPVRKFLHTFRIEGIQTNICLYSRRQGVYIHIYIIYIGKVSTWFAA